MKTKEEFAKKAHELNESVVVLTKAYEKASKKWLSDHSGNDDKTYQEYCKAERLMRKAKKDAEHYNMLASDGPLYANQHFYTDWEPWEVIEIVTDNCIIVREMSAEVTEESAKKLQESFVPGGFFGHTNNDLQKWDIKSNPDGQVAKIRRHKDGAFYLPNSRGGSRFWLDTKPYKYYDYNF